MAKIPQRGGSNNKTSLEIKAFGGINTLPNRKLGQPSAGKNFLTVGGKFRTRPGLVAAPGITALTKEIRSLHFAKMAQTSERFLAETVDGIYYYDSDLEEWDLKDAGYASNYGFSSAIWRDEIVLAGGNKMNLFGIETPTLTLNFTTGSESGAAGEGVAVFKDRVFLFGPNYAPAYKLKFNGYEYVYDEETEEYTDEIVDVDIFVWPEKYQIPANDGDSILSVIPTGSSMFILTGNGYWHVYGNNEDDFEVIREGDIGCYDLNHGKLVGDIIVWLGKDKKVYVYTGSTAEHVSGPIDEYLSAQTFSVTTVRCHSFSGQFWIIFRGTTTTAYVFDTVEKQWYIYEFPVNISAACMRNNIIHFGTSTGAILQFIEGVNDNGTTITTDSTLGPINMQSRKIKVKNFYISANPGNDFDIDISSVVDDYEESSPDICSFNEGSESTQNVKVNSRKGLDIYVKISSTDIINELSGGTIIVSAGQLK